MPTRFYGMLSFCHLLPNDWEFAFLLPGQRKKVRAVRSNVGGPEAELGNPGLPRPVNRELVVNAWYQHGNNLWLMHDNNCC